MPTTAAISAGLGAAGSIGGALISSNAAQNASNQQVAEQRQALAQQQALYNQGLGVATNALNPFITAGQSVLPTLQGLITPGANQNALLSQTPGFQFASQYGTMAATNALAARGGASGGGNLATAISQYNQGLAGNTWQNVVNALQGYANTGATAAGTLGGAALNAGVGEGNAQASTLTGIGQAQAAGTLGSANALAGGLTGTSNAASNALLYSQLFGNGGLGGNNGIYSSNALANGPTSSQISNMTPGQAQQYEELFG
jgi:hypothetical protein